MEKTKRKTKKGCPADSNATPLAAGCHPYCCTSALRYTKTIPGTVVTFPTLISRKKYPHTNFKIKIHTKINIFLQKNEKKGGSKTSVRIEKESKLSEIADPTLNSKFKIKNSAKTKTAEKPAPLGLPRPRGGATPAPHSSPP